jgi:DNA modification methylase
VSSIADVLSGQARYCVLHSDVLEVVRGMPDGCVDFVMTDVPYGLGSHEPTPAELLAYLQGMAGLNTGGDFMGSKWEIPSVEVWREIFRVCKPGAHVFCYAGTRTWDVISLGLRAAGFTNRDTIAMDHPALRWLQTQGMAKGQNVGKAIDKSKGAERPKVLVPTKPGNRTEQAGPLACGGTGMTDVSLPATPEAAEWEGYGSCLAPTWEPILVFRKPLDGTLANNCLVHGCGALNIDACRTYTDWQEADRPESWKRSGVSVDGYDDSGRRAVGPTGLRSDGINCHPRGRWPKNTVMVHSELCRCVGMKKVEGPAPEWEGQHSTTGSVARGRFVSEDVYQKQTRPKCTKNVPAWECHISCPIRLLESQAGNRKSGAMRGTYSQERDGILGNAAPRDYNIEASDGSAARFFPCFPADPVDPFLFEPKADRAEREIGCEHLPPVPRKAVSGREEGSRGQADGRSGVRRQGEIRNPGKCVKPIAVDRWLARLGGKVGGVALVPYCGTGSEAIGCLLEGMRVVAIENDPTMIPVAEARIAWWLERPTLNEEAKAQAKVEARGQIPMFPGAK